jgi:hypothetical protein
MHLKSHTYYTISKRMKAYPIFRSSKNDRMPMIGAFDIARPNCKTCNGELSHIFSLSLSSHPNELIKSKEGSIHLFQCKNDPGMCDDWDSEAGGNLAVYLSSMQEPKSQDEIGLAVDTSNLLDTQDSLIERLENDSECVGSISDRPLWIQADETPNCSCGLPMSFIGQVEESAHPDFNFGGGGCSYVFLCPTCEKSKFLWQC